MDVTEEKRAPVSPGLPAPATAAPLTAYARAPTLMAGQTTGPGGPVQVWAPSKLLMVANGLGQVAVGMSFLSLAGVMALILATGEIHSPADKFGMAAILVLLLSCGVVGVRCLVSARQKLHPVYLTTDDEGIAFADEKGSTWNLRWDSISIAWAAQSRVDFDSGYPVLLLYGPQPAVLSLVGYSRRRQADLLSLVIRRADLQHNPRPKVWCTAAGSNLLMQLSPRSFEDLLPGQIAAAANRRSPEAGGRLWDRFSLQARSVVVRAEEMRVAAGSSMVCPEDLLMALLTAEDPSVEQVLVGRGVDREALRLDLEAVLGGEAPPGGKESKEEAVLDPRTKLVLDLCLAEVVACKRSSFGPEDLLLGVAAEGQGIACEVLSRHGLETGVIRQAIEDLPSGPGH